MNKSKHLLLALIVASSMMITSLISSVGGFFNVYAEGGISDKDAHHIVTNDNFFSSLLKLDSNILEDGFTVEVKGTSDYTLAYFNKEVPRTDDNTLKKNPNHWYGDKDPKRYERFYSEKTGEIPAYSLVFPNLEEAEKAEITLTYPQIGTYNDKAVGMRAVVKNIDAQKNLESQEDDYYGRNPSKMDKPGFQFSAKPEGGILQNNVHKADYYLEFFYSDNEANQKEGIVGKTVSGAKDIYVTLSSLSMGFQPINGQYWQPEKVKPITDIQKGFIVNNSDVFTSFDNNTSYSSSKDQYYDVAYILEHKNELRDRGAFDQTVNEEDDGYYAPFTGEYLVKGYRASEGADAEKWLMDHDPGKPGITGSWGYWSLGNDAYYNDNIGHSTFTKNAASFLYSDSSKVGFRTNTVNNSMWFTIYPQGLTNMIPAPPAVSADDPLTKSVNDGNEHDVPAAGYQPGDVIKYTASQQVNELSYNSIVRYNSMSISSTVPDATDLLNSGRRVYYLKEQAKLNADGIAEVNPDTGEAIMEIVEVDVTNKGTFSAVGNTLTFTFNEDWLKDNSGNGMPLQGETYYMTLEAQVKEKAKAGTELKNDVVVKINNDEFEASTSAKVIEKENVEEHLDNRNDEFIYVINQVVPTDATEVVIKDELNELLEVVSAKLVYVDENGDEIEIKPTSDGRITLTIDPATDKLTADDGKNQVVEASMSDGVADVDKHVTAIRGKMLALKIVAKIRDGVTDEQLDEYAGWRIPNEATFKFNDNPEKKTNKVVVIPPLDPVKKVGLTEGDTKKYGKDELADVDPDTNEKIGALPLASKKVDFVYTIEQMLPEKAVKAVWEDKLDKVLEVVEGSAKLLDQKGNVVSAAKIVISDDKGTITATLEAAKDKTLSPEKFTLVFKAKLRKELADGTVVDDAYLIKEYGEDKEIPNTANVAINDNPGVDTNKVLVTPPDDPKKKVNGQTDIVAVNKDVEFTYTITQKIPKNAVKVEFEDTLKDVLEVVKEKTTIDVDGVTPSVSGQKVTAKITDKATLEELADKEVTLTIVAKIKANVTDEQLKPYIDKESQRPEIPNKATVKINDSGQSTNEVLVTPPEEPEKKVNNQTDIVVLKNRDELFTYTVSQVIPKGANEVEFVDELESVLEIVGNPTLSEEGTIDVTGQKVTATITDKDLLATLAGKRVTLTIKAKIKSTATDEDLEAYTDRTIPNEATVKINGNGQPTNKVEVAPPEKPEKEINGAKELVLLKNRDEQFTYTVSQVIPKGATEVTFEDTLESVLEIVGNPTLSEKGNIDVTDQKVTATITDKNLLATLVGKKVTLTIVAKIKSTATDADLEKHTDRTVPNEATVNINGNGQPTNKVEVVPPEEPEKKVDGKDNLSLTNRDAEFTFTVSQVIPNGAVDVVFSDTLVDVLEFVGTPTIDADDAVVDVKGQTVTATIADATELKGQKITLTIKAKIKSDVTNEQLAKYINEETSDTEIPNEAEVNINGKGQVTNKVIVIPPDEPEKFINGQKDLFSLENRDEEFTYTVTQKIPEGAVNVVFEDTLEDVLEVVGKPTIDVDGVTPIVTESEGKQTVTATIKDPKDLAGKTVTLTIKAKIKADVTDAQLIEKYGTTTVPNKAKVTINDKDKTTNEVKVTPPSNPEKTVNDKAHADLENRDEVFTYKVTQTVPAGAIKASFVDELEEVLDVESYEIDNDKFSVSYDKESNTVSATATGSEDKPIVDKDTIVTLTIKAKIKDGVTDAQLIEKYGSTSVPNEAKVTIDDKEKTSNEVKVTPPSDPEKKVNNQAHVDLENRDEVFTYKVTQTVPAGAIKASFVDELEEVLDVESYEIDNDKFSVSYDKETNTVSATATGSKDKPIVDKDKVVTLTIKAKIKADVTDAQLIEKYGTTTVPNKAKVTINGKEKTTNEVKVTPPNNPEKTVSDADETDVEHATLTNRNEQFTYKVVQTVPAGAIKASFVDELEEVLDVESYEIDNDKFSVSYDKETNTVSAIATGSEDKPIVDKDTVVTLTIVAKIKDGVTDAQLIEKYGSTSVPNEAKVTIDDKEKTSNEVKVTPPSDPEKTVNDAAHADLENRDEVFTYKVTQTVPAGAIKASFVDELEEVLDVESYEIDNDKFSVSYDKESNTVSATATGSEEAPIVDKDTIVTLTIKAKIKADVTDAQLLEKYGTTTVPNKAKVAINGKDKTTNEVTVTPPDEPEEDPVKKVNGVDHVDLANRQEEFTYTVTQKIPTKANTAEFEDVLEDVLEVVDAKFTKGDANYVVNVKGNKVTAVCADVKVDRAKEVELTIVAKLRSDVTDEQLIAKYGSTKVPNEATVKIGDNPKTTNTVTVTPPDSPREDPEKEINGQKELVELESRPETFTYTVSQAIPEGAKNVVFEDTLEDVLEIVDEPSINCKEAVVSVDDNKVVATIDDASSYAGKTLTLKIVAKISDSVDDAQLIAKYGSTTIPNKAVVTINDIPRTTNEVKVVPPVEDKEIVKTVNDAQHADLGSADEVFTYDVEVYVPADAEKMTITDKLVDELQFNTAADKVSVTVDGEEIKATKTIDGQLLTVEVVTSKSKAEADETNSDAEDAAAAAAEKAAEAKAKADELEAAAQAAEEAAKEAREAADAVAAGTQEDTEEGSAEGTEGTEEGTEDANNAEDLEAAAQAAEAAAAEARAAADAAAEEAEAASKEAEDAKAAADAAASESEEAEEEIVDLRAKTIKITFKASIKEGADLTKYLDPNGNPRVPNTANYIVNDDPDRSYDSNTVTVTPPTPPADEPEKFINGEKGKLVLTDRADTFVYTITQQMPYNAISAVFEDQVEDVLDVVSVKIDGDSEYVNETKGNLVRFITKDASADRNKKVTMTITAKLRDGITDVELIDKYGTTNVPNKATVAINGNPQATNEVLVTPPKPEELEPVKKVNGKDKVSLSNRDEIFTYTVSQKIPAGSKSAEFEDVLENVLEPIEATINVDGVKPVIKGQTVTATIKDARSCAGKIVVMTIKARIKSSATDAELDAYTNLEIPNIATVAIDGVANLTNEVFVTPPTVKPSYEPDEPTKKTPDKETVVKGSKKVNTGDGVGVIPFIFMLISATAIAGLMFIRRMRKES